MDSVVTLQVDSPLHGVHQTTGCSLVVHNPKFNEDLCLTVGQKLTLFVKNHSVQYVFLNLDGPHCTYDFSKEEREVMAQNRICFEKEDKIF